MWLELALSSTNFRMTRVKITFLHALLITYHLQTSIYSALKHIIKCMTTTVLSIARELYIHSGPSNVPIVWDPSVSAEKQREIGHNFISKLEFCDLPRMNSMFEDPSLISTVNCIVEGSCYNVWDDIICPYVG